MILVALFIGVILIVAAIRNSQGALFTALRTDVSAFVIWAAALVAVGSLGFVPGLKGPSRALLGLVLVVIVLRNYEGILSGFQNAWQHPPQPVTSNPTGSTGGTAAGAGATGGGGSDMLSGISSAFAQIGSSGIGAGDAPGFSGHSAGGGF